MLIIDDFKHLRNNKKVSFKEEVVNKQTFTIVSYMIADDDLWKIYLAKECRGITFDSAGRLACLPFQKFFNLDEKEDTQYKNIDWSGAEVYTKVDGSMITPVLVRGNIYLKTKKSFYSDVAVTANKAASDQLLAFCKNTIENKATPIFEFTSPSNRIVIDYGRDASFTLLAIRDWQTGKMIPYDDVCAMAAPFDVNVVEKHEMTIDDVLKDVEKKTDFEGYVIHADKLVKVKTPWYIRNHRMLTQLRVRDVAEMVIDETIDDILGAIHREKLDDTEIRSIESKVLDQYYEMIDETERLYTMAKDKNMSAKELAMSIKGHKYFSLVMSLFNGKDPYYNKAWKKMFLKDYSLDIVFCYSKDNVE